MRNFQFSSVATILAAAAVPLLLAGCGLASGGGSSQGTGGAGAFAVTGNVHGGQQPVGNSTVNIYAVGTTGYGSAAVSLLNSGVTVKSATDGTGGFVLTGKYTCSPEQRVYVTATGGDAGSGNNPALAMMAAMGRCGDLSASTFISLNEVTTVASVWALAPFMSDITHIGAPGSNVTGINNAFNDVNTLASISFGSAGGSGVPSGTVIPIAAINTIADILAACINSDGTGAGCSTLFAGATSGGNAPADTLAAALNMAQHPATGVAALFPLVGTKPPFQPVLADQPSDFTLAATFPGFNTPTSVAADAGGNVWVADSGANSVTQLSHAGVVLVAANGLSAPTAVAVDQGGNAWVANGGNSTVAKVTAGGAVATFSGGGLNLPNSISIDGQGNVWLANAGNNTVSEFSNAGIALSGPGFPSAGGTPIGVAIDPR